MLYSRKVKMQLKHTQNYLCSVWRRCGDWADFLKWFVKFRAGCFLLDDTAQPCAPVGADDHPVETSRAVMCATGGPLQSACAAGRPLQSRVPQGGRCSHVCRRGAAAALGMPRPSAEKHLCQLSYVNHCDVWVPHKQREKPSRPSFHMQFSSER